MKPQRHFALVLAASLALALGACSSSSDDDPPEMTMAEPEPMPEPEPEPEPVGPTDLEETQAAAAAQATAAGEAATAAAASAKAAADATKYIATMQTGGTAAASAAAADAAATAAMASATAASTAADAAADATTGDGAEDAWARARTARNAADAAAELADTSSEAAIDAAKTELHINSETNVHWRDITNDDGMVTGMSSVDTDADSSTAQADNTVTGFIRATIREADAITGVHFDQRGTAATEPADDTPNATDVAYVQAVAAGTANIGKTLDTSDDMARLTIISAREGKRNVRVFADMAAADTAGGLLTATGTLVDIDTRSDATGDQFAEVKSIGDFYEATTVAGATGAVADALDATDSVNPASDPVELFELSGTIMSDGTDGTAVTSYARVTETRRDGTGEVTGRTYQAVDITAVAAVDSPADGNNDPEQVQVTAEIPVAVDYEHINFGVWAALRDNEEGDNSVIDDLGIGFVQNFDGSGVTTGHVTGTANYIGDWVAVVQPMHSTVMRVEDGHATMEANFSTDEFEANLVGLAMLEGTLSGNTFTGTSADVDHVDMDGDGTFTGTFSGAVYGPDGAEAAGVFRFVGADNAGAFTGAFGGRDEDQ